MDSVITSLAHMEMKNDSPVKGDDIERAKAVFSKYYEYLPYKRRHRESVLNVLYSRETGTSSTYCCKPSKTKCTSSTRKNQCFYMRSLCAAKFGSSAQPLSYPITNVSKTRKEVDQILRPRQFEYHPTDSSLMAVGTLDGEVVVLNHETGNILSCIFPSLSMNSILGLCWLKQQPSKIITFPTISIISCSSLKSPTLFSLLVGSDNGCLRLYDINEVRTKVEGSYCNSTVIFDDFELLTSVHVNSTDDRCLASGYSKKVAIYDICSGQRLQLFTDLHHEPINVAKFSNHSPSLFVTSSFDRDVKMWDSRQKPVKPCYSSKSSRGNVMVVFSPDDLYLLVSAIDNEVRQLLTVDGRLHMDFGIVSTGSSHNYTRSYYMNERDYIISGSSEEPTIRVCCAHTGRRLRDISLEDTGRPSSIYVQSLRSDPFRHFHMAILAAYARPSKYEIVKINLLSSSHSTEESQGGLNISYGKGG